MTKSSYQNLGECLARLADPKRAEAGLKADRAVLAARLRAARIRVKENKARNGGVYVA